MRTIKLKSLSLVNFKGIRNLTIDFNDAETLVCGGNGAGKTTIFDSFLWLLFGKDSAGRSDSNFNIKTLDENGMPILHLEHYVAGVLNVDGKDVKLQRSYVENWVKPRGTTEETLQNHKTEFYLNDVKLSTKKEYDAEVSSIIPEDIFRLITNPFYFTSLKPESQKEILLDMAGNVTDDEVAKGNEDYIELLSQLNGRSLQQFAKEVAAKKRACKDEIAVIPSQIETAKKLMPEEEDWVALDATMQSYKNELKKIDDALSDKSKLNEQEYQRKANLQNAIGNKKLELSKIENEIRQQADNGRNKALLELKDMEYQLNAENVRLRNETAKIDTLKLSIESDKEALSVLRGEYASIYKETLEYPDGAFICPTCKRPLEVDDIEEKQREMQANFNERKAARLKDNQTKGKARKQQMERRMSELDMTNALISEIKANIERMNSNIEAKRASIPESVNVESLISSDQRCIDLKNEIIELNNQLTMEAKQVDLSSLQSKKCEINDNVQALIKRIAKREQIERAETEIKRLEEMRIANNQKLADLEKLEFTALQFQKDKDAELMKRINGMFSFVSFSFVDTQLNGGEKLTCVCTVNGVPYPDVNNAGKYNAGIDIINGICKAKGVYAPIFLDNRESVNRIIPTQSQIINLCVSNDSQLVIK